MTAATAARESTGTPESVVQRRPAPSAGPEPSVPDARWVPSTFRVQAASLRVSTASDPAEREAESVSERVVATDVGSAPPAISCAPTTSGAPARRGDEADLRSELGGGSALPSKVAKSMGESLGADFSGVRIHTDARAASLANRFAAKAFTVGSDVFFSKGAYQPDSPDGRKLLAHELVHVVQQGAAGRKMSSGSGARTVSRSAAGVVQRLGVSDALDYFADKANLIPGFRMLTILMGFNPINLSRVERSAANVLRAVIEFVPGGGLITQALDNHGIFEKAGAWVSDQLKALGDIGSSIKQALKEFIDGLSWTDIFDLGGVWERAKRIFTDPVTRIKNFVVGLVTGFVTLIKDAILKPIGALAKGTEGWKLLCAVLGRDPITGEAVPRDAETLIGGFMRLIGQGEVWENMKKANAIARCFAWFQGAAKSLVAFVAEIPSLFVNAFRSLELVDIILVPRAFVKLARVFGGFLGRFVSWAGNAVWNLLEIIFDCVSPGAWSYIKKTGAALREILRNPIPFMRNLVKAGIGGFDAFKKNFVPHLQAGLIDWLTGSLPGVYIPKSFSLKELVTFVLSVLGISWQLVRGKIVKAIGEPAMTVIEKTLDIVVTLVRDGPAAAWEKIKEELGNLKEMVVGGILDMVKGLIVQKAIPKLVAMFIPGAGFISAILAIYDTVMVFVQKISKIIQVVTAFVNSIVAIAAGNIGAAVSKVESILAGLLGLAINFLMGFAGLGKIADKIMGVITKIRAKVDAALDKVVAWIVKMAKALLAKVKSLIGNWWKSKKPFRGGDNKPHTLLFVGEGRSAKLVVRSVETPYSDFVARAVVNGDAAKTAAKAKAVPIAEKIDETRNLAPSKDDAEEGRRATKINDLLESLAPHTAVLFGSTIPKSASAPSLGGVNGAGFGTSMSIKPLTNKDRPKGSAPTSTHTPEYFKLNERRDSPGGASYYIKGHLLNQQLGGLGIWDNMTPLSRSGNAQHERKVESVVKRTVDLPAIVEYEVKPNYAAQPNKAQLLKEISKSAESPLMKETKKKIVEAEDWVPASLSIGAWILDETLKRKETLFSTSVANPIERTFASYHLSSSPKPTPVNLSSDLEDTIQSIEGIGPTLAKRIVEEREKLPSKRWSTYAQLASKVSGIGEARLVTLESSGHIKLF